MKVRLTMAVTMALFVSGVGVGHAAKRAEPPVYRAQATQVAAQSLLQRALAQAGDGTWERIAVGRVYYLGGMKNEGQAIFDTVLGTQKDASDLVRVARVYREAGEWARAKALFDKAVVLEPKDEKLLAEVGAHYLINGDRETAESLFDRSFKLESELWATVSAAGGYLGVKPQE